MYKDWKKLVRVLVCLKGMPEEFLALSMEETKLIKWCVDGLHTVHGDMISHTGGMVSMGEGVIYSTSNKHKLNTKRSTEMYLMAMDDVMLQLLWTRFFWSSMGTASGRLSCTRAT